ncbi:MAG: HrpE/YscL family type III secretion apparatus protein [Desulfovibrionaceae bacterium]|nr:HrpE/YscL family type III secretion apparatus protein [Desulfovibrionaceae bacterium]
MGALFRLNSEGLSPSAGTKLIKAEEYASFAEASSLLAEARKKTDEMLCSAEEVWQARHDEGYRDGVEEGKLELSEKMLETALSSVEFIENIERTLVDVVNKAVRKIIGELDDAERITRIVRTALNTVRGQHKVIIRVAPADEPVVSAALAAMTAKSSGESFLTILADTRLSKDSCIVESELGVVDASLETQLKAIEHAFLEKIQQQ